jgi:hypothetical protein
MHPEAATKGHLDAFAAKILAAVAIEPRVSPPTSRVRSFVEAASSMSPPQSIPQSALTRMTTTSTTPISLRKFREIRVKTNFNEDNRPRAGHSRTSTEIVKMANAGIERAGLLQGPPGSRTIEMAAVQVSGDYLLMAKDAATAERLTMNGPKWVTCLGGNAEVITPTYGVMVMNIPVTRFDPREQNQMIQMIVGQNEQLLANHPISHVDWCHKPKPGKATGTIVISFMTRAGANAALVAGCISFEDQIKNTIRYSRACKVLQCFKCYEYGHITRQCRNEEKCGHCAGGHPTKDCLDPTGNKTCALCKGNHPGWAQSCEYRKKEMARIETELQKVKDQPYYPEDPVISPGPSERGSVVSFSLPADEDVMDERPNLDPTPAEAANILEASTRTSTGHSTVQASQVRSPELTTLLRPQGIRKNPAPKPAITPTQARRAMAGLATKQAQVQQCEPGSDVIEVLDNSQIEEISPPSTQSEGYQVEKRRQSQRGNRRTRNNQVSNE